METIRQFAQKLKKRIQLLIGTGDLNAANELTANMLMGSVALWMSLGMLLVLALNEMGVFTADKPLMRETVLIAIGISIVIRAMNFIFRGDRPWLKYALLAGIVLEAAAMSATLGHNVVLVTIIPALLAIRYFNVKVSIFTSIVSVVFFGFSTTVCSYMGIVNINVLPLPEGTTITIDQGLRASIMALDFDRLTYVRSYFQNDYVPRFIIFSMVTLICILIAKKGRQLIDMQNEITQKTARIKTELNLAQEIQTNVLPRTMPAYPEHENVELYAKNIPAKEVGGDFYDYFCVDSDHVAFLIADVSGKGVGAALFMMISKTIIKNQLQLGISPAKAMKNANDQLCEHNSAGLFVTVWCGIFEVSTGIVRYVSAGHNPPIIKRKGEQAVYMKGRSGFVLAGIEGTVYQENETRLEKGDELFLYTDGVTEAANLDKQFFGENRLLDCIDRFSDEAISDQISDILTEVDEFVGEAEQFDDITMLGVKVH